MSAESSKPRPDQPTGSFARDPGAAGKPGGASPQSEAAATQLVRVLDQYLADLKTGQAPSREQLIAEYPELATQLEACMAGLEFLHAAESPHPDRVQRLGDFRIIREVGRGGMGAVFEAEQLSLSRRVALKILRFGSVSDPEAIERFRREAETVAKLHHTNIVPIFAVGSERGVNYYAMQFIEGQSLAEVLAKHGGPLPPERVAGWGLQAADALTHAHQRGVIHRDVKPSNLILDNEERLWLTDFGLARRMDDVTLSLTGALLGTPRYMSPEQATAAHKHVDHRSDLFSLGATLYELLAGKPAFAGQTPHEVIQHILECKPAAIREVVPSVPRDLETIVYKCMAKERSERYENASELAEDLRAYLDGRPIRARRASAIELAVRWLRQQQRSVKLVSAATAATLLVMVLAFASWRGYEAWQETTLKLSTPTPPLVAEILGPEDEVLRVETVPTQLPLVMPAGKYQLRVSGEGTLSETFAIDLNRNEPATPGLELLSQDLWAPQDVERSFALIDFPDEQALVLLGKQGLKLAKRIAPVNDWTVELSPKQTPALAKSPGFRWLWSTGADQYSGYGVHDLRPYIAPKAVDLNGDGTPDIVCAARHQGWVMALSGLDGKVLWFAGRAPELLAAPAPQNMHHWQVRSAVMTKPIFDQDCDGDGVPDVIATFADVDLTQFAQQNVPAAHRWIEAISGRTGQSLWVYELPKDWFTMPNNMPVPYQMRWFCGSDMSYSSNSGGGAGYGGRHRYRQPPHFERSDTHAYRPDVQLVKREGKPTVAVVAADRLAFIDPKTGQADGEIAELPSRCQRPCQWADLDGDDAMELMLLDEVAATANAYPNVATCELTVWSPEKNETVWTQKLDARWPDQAAWSLDMPLWPLIVDLNGDGAAEVIVPDERGDKVASYASSTTVPSSKLVVLEGKTGELLWSHRLVSLDAQVDRFIAGPDIDGDGWREVYAATVAFSDSKTFVDALSGKTGKTLWTNSQPLIKAGNSSEEFRLQELFWWNAGADGWPHLVVQAADVNSAGYRGRALAGSFSAATGELAQIAINTTSLQAADIDHDGLQDLVLFNSKSPGAYDIGGKVHVIRGLAGESWRELASVGQPAGDLDGDGVEDLVVSEGQLVARSGRSGQVLWRAASPTNYSQVNFRPASPRMPIRDSQGPSMADLDGDGADDLLAWSHQGGLGHKAPTFFAISGRTGKTLWSADEITCTYNNGALAAEARDLDGDGLAEVIWLAAIDYGYPDRFSYSTSETQLWMFVTSGQNGKLKWAQALSPAYGKTPTSTLQIQLQGVSLVLAVGDVDKDGVADIVTPAILPVGQQLETQVLSGKDGHVLWRRPYNTNPNNSVKLESWITPRVCDLDGDGTAEVVFSELAVNNPQNGQPAPGPRVAMRVAAVHGADGAELWSWKSDNELFTWYSGGGQTRSEMLQPVVLRTGTDKMRVAALLPESERRIVLLSADGEPQLCKLGYSSHVSWVLPADVTGTGKDSLIALDSKGIVAIDVDDVAKRHWSRPLGSGSPNQILTLLPAKTGDVVAVATDPTNNSVLGLDVATGATKWVCPGPIGRGGDGTYLAMNQIALIDRGGEYAPQVLYALAGMARCRQGAYVNSASAKLEHSGSLAARGVAVAAPRLGGVGRDERWLRDLPWRVSGDGWGNSLVFVGTGLLLSLLLVVIPAAYVAKIAIRRQFTLRMQLMLPVVAGLMLTASLAKVPIGYYGNPNLAQRFGVAMTLAPVIVAVSLLVVWCLSGRARRSVFWLAMTIPVSCVLAAVALAQTYFSANVPTEVGFDWTGWQQMWFYGAYMTTYFLMVTLFVQAALRFAKRKAKRAAVVVLERNESAPTVLEPTIATEQHVEI